MPTDAVQALGKHSPRWKQFLTLNRAASRRDLGLFLVEGPKLLLEAQKGHHRLKEVIFDPERWQPQGLSVPAWAVSAEMLARLSETEHCQGVVGLMEARPWSQIGAATRVVVADHLADPGNLGVLLRTAWATGVEAVLTLGGVDPLHPKVVRASAGAVFHVPCERVESIQGYHLMGMVPRGGTCLYEMDWPQRWALVVGNEAHGISPEVESSLDQRLTIPMAEGCESLNAATSAAVVLFEWRRISRGL